MQVLRLEKQHSKKGVYENPTNSLAHMASRYQYLDEDNHRKWHPAPYDDPQLREWWEEWSTTSWHFGFKDEKQLLAWFPKSRWNYFIDWNEETNFEDPLGISRYEIDDQYVKLGSRQLCFRRDLGNCIRHDIFRRDNVLRKIINAMAGQ